MKVGSARSPLMPLNGAEERKLRELFTKMK
jgi:hypothetical protein